VCKSNFGRLRRGLPANPVHCPTLGVEVFCSSILNPENCLLFPTELVVPLPGGVKTRFIRVERVACADRLLSDDDQCILSIAQVIAVATLQTKLEDTAIVHDAAFGCRATQSSQADNNPAVNAVDNRFDTFSHTHPSDKQAWLEVDLKSEAQIRIVCLWNRMDGWLSRLRDLTLELRDKDRVLVFQSFLNISNSLGSPPQINVHTGGGIFAQFVTIRRSPAPDIQDSGDRNVLSLVRVQVLTPNSNPAPFLTQSLLDIARLGFVETLDQAANLQQCEASAAAATESCAAANTPDAHVISQKPNLVVFLQHSFWQNYFTSSVCDRRSRVCGEWAVRLQYALMDFFVKYSEH
jgi:hypothetical protein